MIGVSVTFSYDGDFDRARVIGVADNARGMFEGMPGLRFKFFTFDEQQQRATNFYVWESQEAAERFFTTELRERVTRLYGVAPSIDFVEIAQIVDNSGLVTEEVIPNGELPWDAGRRADDRSGPPVWGGTPRDVPKHLVGMLVDNCPHTPGGAYGSVFPGPTGSRRASGPATGTPGPGGLGPGSRP